MSLKPPRDEWVTSEAIQPSHRYRKCNVYVALELIFWCDFCWTLEHRIAIFCEQYTIVALLNILPAFIYYQNTIISICKVRPLTHNESYFLCFDICNYMSWYIRSFFGFSFLNILYFFKYSCSNISHIRSLYTFYSTIQPLFVLQICYATSVYIVTLRDAQELII